MNRSLSVNMIRAVILFLLQVLIFKNVTLGSDNWSYFQIFIYPLFLVLLPAELTLWIALLIGFGYGLALDMFYDTLGIHAAVCVFTVYVRPLILRLLVPREGYKANKGLSVKNYGLAWFTRYAGTLLLAHIFIFFSVDAFSFVYLRVVLLSTLASFLISFGLILIQQFIFKNEY